MVLAASQSISVVLFTPWQNDDGHMWGAIYLAMFAVFLTAVSYLWWRDGTAALNDRLARGGEKIAKALSKSPFSSK
jgi:hypothetical protein